MIGWPEVTDEGLKITSLLNPALRIVGLLRVQSMLPACAGDYTVISLHCLGDVMGEPWLSTITCMGGHFQTAEQRV